MMDRRNSIDSPHRETNGMWIRILIAILMITASKADSEDFLSRLNYGVIATKDSEVTIVDDFWIATVHVELPQIPQFRRPDMGCPGLPSGMAINETRCNSTQTEILTSLYDMWDKIIEILEGYDTEARLLVPDIRHSDGFRSPPRRRRQRGLFDFIGTASSFLFGTATTADVEALREELSKIRRVSAGLVEIDAQVRNDLSSFMTVQNERLSGLHDVLATQQSVLDGLHAQIQDTVRVEHILEKSVRMLERTLSYYLTSSNHMAVLVAGLEQLSHGQLSPRLVPQATARAILRNISFSLTNDYHLALRTVRGLYSLKSFDFARQESDIIIRIKIPLTKQPRMSVYKIRSIPMPVPGDQGFVSKIDDLPKLIVHVPNTQRLGVPNGIPDHGFILSSNVIWHTTDDSCILAILDNQV